MLHGKCSFIDPEGAEMAKKGDIVAEFLGQNSHLEQWLESLAGECETEKQWRARKEFILRNMESFPNIQPGNSSHSLDQLLSLSMVWSNHVFLGCRYPQQVMDKITGMAEGIIVNDIPLRKTRDEIIGKGIRKNSSDLKITSSQVKLNSRGQDSSRNGSGTSKSQGSQPDTQHAHKDKSLKNVRSSSNEDSHVAMKCGPSPQAPKEYQAFFNRLYKAVAWKLVSAGGFGPNLDYFAILQACVESSKSSLTCIFVPLKEIPDLPSSHSQQEGLVCELRCRTVYLGTGYGRGEDSAKAMAAREALKVFQGRKVTVKICKRKYHGQDVEDLILQDDQLRNSGLPPALSYPFESEHQDLGNLNL
ncbi:CDKN2A-interacting protein isoform X1 [Polypterus senegalus]|uniref:CDKN2A-interacting protein isoform X1 n=1 Tax=Polypterus senegalus TaxID=55291 RepID=UPI0019645493|nr:CDKN2A-interacting protein isoform X1 [Polypterus senegalus]